MSVSRAAQHEDDPPDDSAGVKIPDSDQSGQDAQYCQLYRSHVSSPNGLILLLL